MSIEELQKIVASLQATLKQNEFSPYEMNRIVNDALDLDLPPQMFYNYVRKNMIVSHRDERNKILVFKKDVIAFVERYALRNIVSVS